MSDAMKVVMAYATDFEQTYEDDDWSRLAQSCAEDATYEVVGGPMACHIEGRAAIFAGIKKSLDGFDRRFDQRSIELLETPELVAGEGSDTLHMRWQVNYRRGDAPMMHLPGSSTVTVADGAIVALRDDYNEAEMGEVYAWMASHGADLDPSYV